MLKNKITQRAMEILDAKYEKADLQSIVSNCNYLSKAERSALLKLLLEFEIYLMAHLELGMVQK